MITLSLQVNSFSQAVHRQKLFPNSQLPAKHKKELFGVEYLYAQSGVSFSPKMEDFDEGFGEMEDEALYSVSSPDGAEDILTFPTVSDSESDGRKREDHTQRQQPHWHRHTYTLCTQYHINVSSTGGRRVC